MGEILHGVADKIFNSPIFPSLPHRNIPRIHGTHPWRKAVPPLADYNAGENRVFNIR